MDHDHLYIFSILLKHKAPQGLKKFGPGVSEEKSFKDVNGWMDGWTDGRRTESDYNSSS